MANFAVFLAFLLLVEFTVGCDSYPRTVTIIGNNNIVRRNHVLVDSFSKLFIDGPFYCHVTWTDSASQSINIDTDSNIQPHVLIQIEHDTLKMMLRSNTDFKFTEMNVELNLSSTIRELTLAGIGTFNSNNPLKMNDTLKLRTDDTSSVNLHLDVLNLDAILLSAGSTRLIGRVNDKTSIKYNGVGDVDALELISKRVNIDANGLGTISITGTSECIIKAAGVSIVRYQCARLNLAEITELAQVTPI